MPGDCLAVANDDLQDDAGEQTAQNVSANLLPIFIRSLAQSFKKTIAPALDNLSFCPTVL
jgi:hypothetical protein